MSNMKNMQNQLDEQQRQDAVYEAAMASVRRSQRAREAGGYAVMSAAMGYGESAMGKGWFSKINHAAKLFCIAAAFIIPNALIVYLVF
ncbi:hypothetical protein [Pseudaestuariivita rosea]|uniref:hypothetical protein n=1 Tax=Pseudaestuariivita rosea TaxID=2763263 RepID=UPI001ABA1B3E|nr:hypothetical protein [Pseudaestuariivita rosea]